jgi:hypothetical protein
MVDLSAAMTTGDLIAAVLFFVGGVVNVLLVGPLVMLL